MAVETHTVVPGVSERWELRMGATVYATDDVPGNLRQVVVFPGMQKVVALVVRDVLPSPERLIPIEAVDGADEEQIQLSWSMEEVRAVAPSEVLRFHTPELSSPGVAPEAQAAQDASAKDTPTVPAPVRIGLQVAALDGGAGHVSHVLMDSVSLHATHLVVHQGLLPSRDRIVSMDWFSSITEKTVTLAATRAELATLPEYCPDKQLAGKILEAWLKDSVVQPVLFYSDVRAPVCDGIATLEGYTWSIAQRIRLEELARGVPGVLGIHHRMASDEELATMVAGALAEEPQTRECGIQVQSYLGNVHLHGTVPDKETRMVAETVAARVPYVQAVVNLLQITGLPTAEPPRLIEPRAGRK